MLDESQGHRGKDHDCGWSRSRMTLLGRQHVRGCAPVATRNSRGVWAGS
jgi:hypothetical protein